MAELEAAASTEISPMAAEPESAPPAPSDAAAPAAVTVEAAAPESEAAPELVEEVAAPESEAAPELVEVAAPVSAAELAMEDEAPQEPDGSPAEPVGLLEQDDILSAAPDHKRKLGDLEQPRKGEVESEEKQDAPADEVLAVPGADEVGADVAHKVPEPIAQLPSADAEAEAATLAKRPRLDGETENSAFTEEQEMQNSEGLVVGNGQPPSANNEQHLPADKFQPIDSSISQPESLLSEGQLPFTTSRRFEVPNDKVGVLIGKSGETIRVLQHNSGAKIQITRDKEADPNSTSRPVELIGTLENINKAEQLIKDVIAEAEAGGSPALVARGFGNAQPGTEQHELHVPNEKVGWIIGKGGETIKSLQTRSGARIQLIPQHLPEGDAPKERIVRITGNKKQIEAAKEMIKEVMIQAPLKHAHSSGGYSQQTFRPRGPNPVSQWGARAPTPTQPATGYDHQQRGMYPPQSTQYPSQPYGSYTQQVPPRSNASAGWEQRPTAPAQTGGYSNYYGTGGQAADNQSIPAPSPSPAPVNYNYGPSQAAGYGQQTPYIQSAPTQQSYSQGYNEQKYDNQAPVQQYYAQQQPMNPQPGAAYPQQGGPQADYAQQQPYSKPAYDGPPQSYGPPRAASQPGDPMYQSAVHSSYGSGGPTQQSYPYGTQSAPPSQPAPAYGQAYGPADGYTQPSSAAGYPQQSSQVAPGYAQGGQPAPAYTQQSVQSGVYGQYPPQQSYVDQSTPNNVNYGYQGGPAEVGYGGNSIPSTGYGSAPVSNQAGYAQPQTYPTGYEQSMPPQSGYGGHPGSVPVVYSKGVSPQPGYGGQYYST